MSKSDYLENWYLQQFVAQFTSFYLALYTVMPTDSGGGTEVVGNNYSRVSVSMTAMTLSGNELTNDNTISFDEPSGSWGSIVGVGVFDIASGGNLLYFTELITPKSAGPGVPFVIAPNKLTIRET